jgi:hypothetical protein
VNFIMNEGRARAMLFGIALCLGLMAYGYAGTMQDEVLWPDLWPWLFGAAALTTAWLGLTLRRLPLMISLALIIAGMTGRVWASVLRAQAGYIDYDRVIALAGGYAALGVLTATVWIHVLDPVVSWHEQRQSD